MALVRYLNTALRKGPTTLGKRALVDLETPASEADEAQVLASLDEGKNFEAELAEVNLSMLGLGLCSGTQPCPPRMTQKPPLGCHCPPAFSNPQPLIQVERDWLILIPLPFTWVSQRH